MELLNSRASTKAKIQKYDTMLEQIHVRKAGMDRQIQESEMEIQEQSKKLEGYQNELKSAHIWKAGKNTEIIYYGNRFCSGELKCIRNMTFEDINNQCQICSENDNTTCSLVLSFGNN